MAKLTRPLQLKEYLHRLVQSDVEFVMIGGIAGMIHGVDLFTSDLDICVSIAPDNWAKLEAAVTDLNPIIRGRPDQMRMPRPLAGVTGLKNLYLDTELGFLDCLGEVPGVGNFAAALAVSEKAQMWDREFPVLTIDALIKAKSAAARAKDWMAVKQLEAIRRFRGETK